MSYQGNPIETTLPVTSSVIVDGSILEVDLATALVNKINGKQDALVQGTSIKSVQGQTVLGSGNIDVLSQGTTIKTVNGQSVVGSGNLDLASLTETLTNKTLNSPIIIENTQITSGTFTAVVSRTYVLTSAFNLYLPATPVAGDWVSVIDRSGTTTSVVGRNGQNIMGLAEDFTIDVANFSATFMYADSTRGWVIV